MMELPARTGAAIRLETGECLTVTNTHGQQVVDTWAFVAAEPQRFMSAPHTWMALGRLYVRSGDVLVDTSRSPILALVEDSSEGHHDLLIPSCDTARYRQLGAEGYHDNCRDNFYEAIAALGGDAPAAVPQPLNLFMNVPVATDGSFAIVDPTAGPGDYVTLRALDDVVIVLSACPQDIAATNGEGRAPSGVRYDVHGELR